MKKTVLTLILILISLGFISAQKIVDRKNNLYDLKEKVEKYAVIIITPKGVQVGTEEPNIYLFAENDNNQTELKTTAQILNFMFKNGWNYIGTIGGNGAAAPQLIFAKRD